MKTPVWLGINVVLAVHERLLAEHGGSAGVRDLALLESALGRPQNLLAYGRPTLFDLAAAYACGIIKNHPFIDGNKRTGFMTAYLFLGRNGFEITASESDVVIKTVAVAANEMTEARYAAWLEQESVPVKRGRR